MRKLPLAFFSIAALCVTCGMVWGIIMGKSEDFTLMPAHAHLNLVGWATMGLMGTFYALSGRGGRLGWLNFGLSTAGVIVMIPSLAIYLAGNKAFEAGVIAGSVITFLGMLTFLSVVLTTWRGVAAAEAAGASAMKKAA